MALGKNNIVLPKGQAGIQLFSQPCIMIHNINFSWYTDVHIPFQL